MRFIALLHLLSFALRHTSPNDRYYLGKQRPNFQAINPKRHFRECYYKPGLKMGSGFETVYHTIRRLFLLSHKMPVFCTIKDDGSLWRIWKVLPFFMAEIVRSIGFFGKCLSIIVNSWAQTSQYPNIFTVYVSVNFPQLK